MQKLFDSKSLLVDADTKLEPSAIGFNANETVSLVSCKASELLDRIKSKLVPGAGRIEFCTAGEFSMHNILNHLVIESGPVDVYISSWTIKEEPARLLFALKKIGKIRALYCIFDYRIKTMDAKHFHFLENTADKIVLTKVHAKAMIIRNESVSWCVTGSANFSNNPRIEIGSITDNKLVNDFHLDWITKVLNGEKVYGA